MFPYQELCKHFEISKPEYDRIRVICQLLDELLDQKIEFQITSYEKDSVKSHLINDSESLDSRYIYKGCIDMEAYEETRNIIPHGPGSLYNSNGQFQQGMFKNGKLDGLGRTIYGQHGWHQGEYSYGQYHGAGAC